MDRGTEREVIVREVGMRDGLQSVATIVPTADKIRWCTAEHAAGVGEIEVASFVPPKLLPQLADAPEVVASALTLPGLEVTALVPNLKGVQRAAEAGVHKVNYVLSVSESHNRSNVRRSVAESVDDFGRIVDFVRTLPAERRPRVSAGLATAFGCTMEGAVDERRVIELAIEMVRLGADELVLADTVGYGNPAAVRRLFRAVLPEVGARPVAAHFHDTRGMGLANVVAALDAGVRRFDASLGGLGGCPYAPGATGNVVMEDLVLMLESMGLSTGVELPALLQVRTFVVGLLSGEQFHGTLNRAGLPKHFRRASAASGIAA